MPRRSKTWAERHEEAKQKFAQRTGQELPGTQPLPGEAYSPEREAAATAAQSAATGGAAGRGLRRSLRTLGEAMPGMTEAGIRPQPGPAYQPIAPVQPTIAMAGQPQVAGVQQFIGGITNMLPSAQRATAIERKLRTIADPAQREAMGRLVAGMPGMQDYASRFGPAPSPEEIARITSVGVADPLVMREEWLRKSIEIRKDIAKLEAKGDHQQAMRILGTQTREDLDKFEMPQDVRTHVEKLLKRGERGEGGDVKALAKQIGDVLGPHITPAGIAKRLAEKKELTAEQEKEAATERAKERKETEALVKADKAEAEKVEKAQADKEKVTEPAVENLISVALGWTRPKEEDISGMTAAEVKKTAVEPLPHAEEKLVNIKSRKTYDRETGEAWSWGGKLKEGWRVYTEKDVLAELEDIHARAKEVADIDGVRPHVFDKWWRKALAQDRHTMGQRYIDVWKRTHAEVAAPTGPQTETGMARAGDLNLSLGAETGMAGVTPIANEAAYSQAAASVQQGQTPSKAVWNALSDSQRQELSERFRQRRTVQVTPPGQTANG